MIFGRRRRPDPVIDVSPMIDIVFQLVLFFMVSTTFVSAPGIEVDLPRASADVVLSEKQDVDIWMTTKGEVFVDDEAVTEAELRNLLSAASKRDPNTLVIIKADTGVPHGRVVTVMDIARGFGLSRLAIATEAPGSGAAPQGEVEP